MLPTAQISVRLPAFIKAARGERNLRRRRLLSTSACRTALLAAALPLLAQHRAYAAVTASGDFSPAPPAGGGNVSSPFRVGITGVGTLAINASTPLNVTGGNAIFGDTATGMGLAELTGFNSN